MVVSFLWFATARIPGSLYFTQLSLYHRFQVLDELFLAFQPEGVHRVIFADQILTLLLLHLLPSEQHSLQSKQS